MISILLVLVSCTFADTLSKAGCFVDQTDGKYHVEALSEGKDYLVTGTFNV